MGSISAGFASAFRDYVVDGVPTSGIFQPEKAAIRALGATIDDTLDMVYPGKRTSWADVIAKWHGGTPIKIGCYCDSLGYGQDTSANGQATQINGSSITRSRYPWPETLSDALALNQFGVTATVYNWGYPGDTAAMGLSRWPSQPACDVVFIAYGTNDGKTLAVPLATFRANMAEMIERELAKGAAVVLVTPPPVRDLTTETNIAAYRLVIRQLAREYGLLVVDAAEQLAGVTNLYQDNVDQVHLSSYAYAELGWHLSALFNNRDAAERKFSAGGFYFPRDMVGYGALYADANAKGGDFITIPSGGRYFLSGYFDDEVLPVFHSYNTSGTNVVLALQYAGNGTNRGVPSPVLTHTASVGARQQLTGVPIRRGWRTVLIVNNGPSAALIEAIEMRPVNAGAMNRGLMAALPALAGAYPSANYLSALGSFWSNIDYSHKLVAPYRFSARCKIVDLAGIAVFKNPPGANEFQDFLFAFRNGNDLYLRDFDGSTPTTTTAVGAFSAGTFDGEIEMVVTSANVKVYLDGVLKITYNSPVNLSGCPGVMAYSTGNGFLCFGAQAQGYVKGPY